MSPKAGFVLLDQIAPRLRATIPHVVKPTGSEDAEELLQDALAMAAQMLHTLEARGKTVTVGNVCYYVTLLMKSGRRSQSANRTDVPSRAPCSMARNIDWAEFLDGHDDRYAAMVRCAVSGQPMNSLGGKAEASNSALSSRKRQLAGDIREFMGTEVMQEVCQRPRWQADVEGEQERVRCRHERQHRVC